MRKGFDPDEVRTFLDRVRHELHRAQEREASLRRQLSDAERRVAHPDLDEATITAALGQETARILRSAHEAAAGVKGRAEDSVAAILREAHEQAAAIRGESETILGTKSAEADQVAATIRKAAEADAEALIVRSRQQADETLEAIKAECRTMLEEAQELRAKVLTDLARRRRVMHTQVEQLRAARETLLETFRDAQRALEAMHEGLQRAETDARISAEAAARRVATEPEATLEDLEAAIAQARDVEASASSPVSGPPTAPVAAPEGPAVEPDAPAPDLAPEVEEAPRPTVAAIVSTPPPALASPEVVEERRLSSLRILRKGRGSGPAGGAATSPGGDSGAVVDEGVRVIGPAEPPEVPSGAAAAPQPAQEKQASGAAVGPEPAPGVAEPAGAETGPAESVGVQPVVGEPEAGERAAGDETVPGEPVAAEPAEGEAATVPAPGSASESPPAPDDLVAAERPGVDELFARIRASRAEAVARANQVLSDATLDDLDDLDGASPPDDARPAPEQAEPPTADPVEGLLQRRDEAVGDIEARLARRLKRILQDDQNDLLDRSRHAPNRGDRAAMLGDSGPLIERLANAVSDHLRDAAAAGARIGADLFNTEAPAVAQEAVDGLAMDVARAVVQPLRRRLERAVREGAEDEGVLADGVSAAYREWKGKRIERLAGDAVAAGFGRGMLEGVPEGAELRWVVDDVDGDCPDCDDNALAGATLRGQSYPTGQAHPPAHGGCRCLLVPANQ